MNRLYEDPHFSEFLGILESWAVQLSNNGEWPRGALYQRMTHTADWGPMRNRRDVPRE